MIERKLISTQRIAIVMINATKSNIKVDLDSYMMGELKYPKTLEDTGLSVKDVTPLKGYIEKTIVETETFDI